MSNSVGAWISLVVLLLVLTPVAAQQSIGSVDGTVRGETGAPVGGAGIRITDAQGQSHQTVADGQGHFHTDNISPGLAKVRINTDCCTTQLYDINVPDGDATVRLDVVVWPQTRKPDSPSSLLWGRTYDGRTGGPLAWVRVVAGSGSDYHETASRADGRYFLELPAGELTALASRVDLRDTRFNVTLTGDQPVDIPVFSGSATVRLRAVPEGTITLTRTAPCTHETCLPQPEESEDGRFTYGETYGSTGFTMFNTGSYSGGKLQPGMYELAAEGGGTPLRHVLEILPGQTWELEARLDQVEDDRFKVTGTVLDEDTGRPLGGIWVDVRNEPRGQSSNGLQTDDQGHFTFLVSPGAVRMSLQPYDNSTRNLYGRTYYADHQTLALRTSADYTIRLSQTQTWPLGESTLQGWIVDSSTGVAGATVQVRNEDTYEWGQAATDSDGSYRFTVRPGRYTLAALAKGHAWSMASADAAGPTTWLNMTLVDPDCCGSRTQGGWYGRTVTPTYYVPGITPVSPTPSPTTSTGPSSASPTPPPLGATNQSTNAASPIESTGAAHYAGAPGGLGAYRILAHTGSATPPATGPQDIPGSPIPSSAGLYLLAGLASLVVVLRRRHG